MEDYDDKALLPVHLILGGSGYAKIRKGECLRVGKVGEPVAELTCFGWSIMSPRENNIDSIGCLAVNSVADYDNLCALDVLGLEDKTVSNSGVWQEYKEQLTWSTEGWYETTLLWKPNHALFLPI